MSKLIHGIGVLDADYKVRITGANNGKFIEKWRCPFYSAWRSMITRCYSKNYHSTFKTYLSCEVCSEWIVFSNFKRWMECQDWQGKHLDKDIIKDGNKIYSPDLCAFVSVMVNSFVLQAQPKLKTAMIGVETLTYGGKFRARCSNPFTKKIEHLGLFDYEMEAHLAWKKRKHELACQLAELQTDERVANALKTRYL